MPVTEIDIAAVRRWCEERVPDRARQQIRLEVEAAKDTLTVVECRAPWDGRGEWTRNPRARLRHKAGEGWSLLQADRNGRFSRYGHAGPWTVLADALAELGADPTSIFWG